MDIISHGLWGATLVRKRNLFWWTFLAGMAPDILGSGPAFLYLLTIGKFWGTETWQLLPQWTRESYHFHHSILSVIIYYIILIIFLRRYSILIIPYLFHVVLDAFVHSTDMTNRLFYPLEPNAGIWGLNWWEHWWIVALNVGGLIVVNTIFLAQRRSR